MKTFEFNDAHPVAEALEIISGDRQAAYGPPERNFARIAALWSVIADCKIDERQVAQMMIALKMARDVNARKRDNVVDILGYAAILGEMEFQKEAPVTCEVLELWQTLLAPDVMGGEVLTPFEVGRYYRAKDGGGLFYYAGYFPEGGGYTFRRGNDAERVTHDVG